MFEEPIVKTKAYMNQVAKDKVSKWIASFDVKEAEHEANERRIKDDAKLHDDHIRSTKR